MDIKKSIWNEAFRPSSLENYVCDNELKTKFQTYIDEQNIPHILLAGRAGSGKTTLAKIFVNNIDCDFLYINATDERSMDVMRDKVGAFASASSFKPLKIVILDEATHLLQASQVILLNMMETYSAKTRFILTGNYPERLIDPLRSRCTEFDLKPPKKSLICETLVKFLDSIEVQYDINDVAYIINTFYPDIRRVLNYTQKYTKNNKLVINKNDIQLNDNYFQETLKILSKPTSQSFNQIRQIVADSGIKMFDETYKLLYKHLDEYAVKNKGLIMICIESYLHKSENILDKEINIMACIAQILEFLK